MNEWMNEWMIYTLWFRVCNLLFVCFSRCLLMLYRLRIFRTVPLNVSRFTLWKNELYGDLVSVPKLERIGFYKFQFKMCQSKMMKRSLNHSYWVTTYPALTLTVTLTQPRGVWLNLSTQNVCALTHIKQVITRAFSVLRVATNLFRW